MTNRPVPHMHNPTVPELLRWLAIHDCFSYMPPMDLHPARVIVASKVKTWANPHRFAVTVVAPSLKFRIDEGHLDRIYLPDAPPEEPAS